MEDAPEKDFFVTSLAVKAFVTKGKKVLFLIGQDPKGNYFWDLPGGGVRKGFDVATSAINKIKAEIPNLNIRDDRPEIFISPYGESTLGAEINGHDILFTGTNIEVDKNFEPELSEHTQAVWLNKKEFDSLAGGDGTLDNPTLNIWLKDLAKAHFQKSGLPFHYQ